MKSVQKYTIGNGREDKKREDQREEITDRSSAGRKRRQCKNKERKNIRIKRGVEK